MGDDVRVRTSRQRPARSELADPRGRSQIQMRVGGEVSVAATLFMRTSVSVVALPGVVVPLNKDFEIHCRQSVNGPS